MHVVNEWLVRVGLDAKKDSGRGVLQDPMRNGVLLCALLTQKLKSTPFSYFKSPRTLTEMRENISKAFERLGEHVPPCYLTSSAEQSVLIGDRQIAYGILWHLWQASHALERATQSAESSSVGIHETRRAEAAELGGKLSARVQPSPLQLDIPAIALAGQGKLAIKDDNVTTYQVKLHDSFARRLAWSENDLTGDDDDDDDVFPVPTAPFSSPVYSDDVDIIPTKTHVMHQIGDDLLPTCSWRRDSVDSSSDSIGSSSFNQNIPSRVAIGELSAAVVTPIADCTDSVEIAEQNRGGDLGVSSTTIKPPAQTQPNAMLSPERVDEVLVWLKRLSLHLKNPSAFHDSNAKLTEFQSGVLLCCIIEKVELMRSIPGITRPTGKQPLSKASALHNITKALNILQQKKTMPLHLLRRATAIYAGNRDVILQLLLQIRKAYGHHLRTPRRPKQHLTSAA
ncbi:hypothetical protein PC128_g9290 [Phytophthora cactorum]|nr:hypothetical protein PC128_g9290 [Phytophthora cactorum]